MRIFQNALIFGILVASISFGQSRTDILDDKALENLINSRILPWYEQGETGTFKAVEIDHKPVKLHYKAFLNSKAKGNIVMVHGFGERIEKYMELAHDFYQEGYSVFLYDQRGFGRSPRLLTNSAAVYVHKFEHYAEDLKLFFDQIVIPRSSGKPLFIFAHSMGGAVTTLFLARYPDLVSRAVLSTPMHEMHLGKMPRWLANSLVWTGSAIGRGMSYAVGQQAPEFPEAFEHAATQSYPRWKWFSEYASRPEERSLALGGASNHWVLEALKITGEFATQDFPQKIKIPILLFQAGKDTWVADAGQNHFCQKAPACQLIRYDDAKHEIYREMDHIRSGYLQNIFSFFGKP